MGRHTGAVNYLIGNILYNTFPMYIFGSGIMSTRVFLRNFIESKSISEAVGVALQYYVTKLTPFPINEFLSAGGIYQVILNIAVATAIGAFVSSFKWWYKY
jgi:hypothetical protein